jgi:hypothetical protein
MLKLERNRRVVVLSARLLLVFSFFAIGLAPAARAEGYQYTVTFTDNTGMGFSAAVTFNTSSILNSSSTFIDPSDVQVLEAIQGDSLDGLIFSGQNFDMDFTAPCSATVQGCTITPGQGNEIDNYRGVFNTPVTAPGTYSFDLVDMTHSVDGGPFTQNYFPGSMTLVMTPEPNSGLMFGSCFLLCTAVALRRRIRIPWRTVPKIR